MQLHPDDGSQAMKHAVESLAAGYIGLDFVTEVGDLTRTTKDQLQTQKPYWAFAHEMTEGDIVLIVVHQRPFALVTVDGEYNYIRTPDPKIGVWFRHFRRVRDARYYADYHTNASEWPRLKMTDTICPLRNDDSDSRQVIQEWLHSVSPVAA
jgi:hypothetical protein